MARVKEMMILAFIGGLAIGFGIAFIAIAFLVADVIKQTMHETLNAVEQRYIRR